MSKLATIGQTPQTKLRIQCAQFRTCSDNYPYGIVPRDDLVSTQDEFHEIILCKSFFDLSTFGSNGSWGQSDVLGMYFFCVF